MAKTAGGAKDVGLLPRRVSLLLLGYLAAMVGDAGLLGALLGRAATGGLDDAALGSAIGLFCGFCYCIFPPVFLASRATLALRAFRGLLWVLLCLHIPLLVWFFWAATVHPGLAGAAILAMPLAVLATLALPAFAHALLRRTWFVLGSDPAGWEPMGGVDGQVERPARPGRLLVLLLPFWAAWRSGARAYGVIIALLWAGGVWFLHGLAVLGVVLLGSGIAIGWAVIGFIYSKPVLAARTFGPEGRGAFLARLLPPARQAPPPLAVSAGLLLLPVLLVLDVLGLGVALGDGAGSGEALIVLLFVVMLPLTGYLPLGTGRSVLVLRLVGGTLALVEMALAAALFAHGPTAMSMALLCGLAPVAVVGLALVNAGRMLNLPAALR
ncbi:hypothetical protein [Acidocella sp.]|uniref:hypothetical protein n=1 Tax=Acidocella sp. TaxID=50710 RepID=UPI003CFCC5B1